ncbi:MAG: hypothetical protein JW895_12135 [Thermoleophilaceae bacterium]|nr:hypothetical protein [Thermoleophilaceae bacterium]
MPFATLRRSLKRPRTIVIAVAAGATLAGCQPVYLSPTGNDAGNCTRSQPCRTFARGAQAAQQQKRVLVHVGRGTYPPQTVPAGNRPLLFAGEPGAKVRTLDNAASGVTFSGLDVDAAFGKTLAFHNSGDNATFKNGRIGNVTDEKGALVSGRNFKFDNVVFHDVRVTDPSVHNECLYAIVVPGMKLRNSTFMRCATMDAFFTYGSWWNPLPPAYGDVTIENNVFAHTLKDDGTWHYYSLYVGNVANNGGTFSGWTVRNNTFEIPANVTRTSATRSRWTGNVGSWNCVRGVSYTHNVGDKCGATDKLVQPSSSTATRPAAFGWVNPAAYDFRLSAGSPAINAASPTDSVAVDRNAKARGAAPDAGALER